MPMPYIMQTQYTDYFSNDTTSSIEPDSRHGRK